jgi:diacylglycerol kinase (ATP)
MSENQVKFLVNPNADLGRAWRSAADLKSIAEEYGSADWENTSYATHATDLARQAAEDGYRKIIAVGGDGTVHEVINGLMRVAPEKRPSLGIIPVGSGNDFAFSMGIHSDPTEALRQAFMGQPSRIDLGSFDIGHGGLEYFDNTMGMGFDATVTIRTHKLTWVHGFMMYLIAVLQTIALNHDAPQMQIETDSGSWDEETIMFVVCNGPREGGGFSVAPGAVYNDGILNYAAVCRVSRLMMLRLIPEVMKGTHGRFKQVRLGQLHRLHLRSAKPIAIHADGEVICGLDMGVREVRVEIAPGAVEIIT